MAHNNGKPCVHGPACKTLEAYFVFLILELNNVRSLAEAAVPRPALLPCLHCTTPLPSLETIMYVKRIFHCVWTPREPGSQRAFVVAIHTPWE